MGNNDFSQEDVLEALHSAETGIWRLETLADGTIKFYGDAYMDYLIGVPEGISPENRYSFFMKHITKEDTKLFMEYYNALKNTEQAEVVYRYNHPSLGIIYVRCGGKRTYIDESIVRYRGFHQNVTNTVRIEQETRKRLTQQAEAFRTLAFKMMEHTTDSAAKISLSTGEMEWINFNGEGGSSFHKYAELFKRVSANVPAEYRDEFLRSASLDNIKKELSDKSVFSFSVFIYRESDTELRRVTYWYYSMDDGDTVLSMYRDTTDDYRKEQQLAEALLMSRQANRAKTVFLNNMSHDIRTPMNAIIGFTDLARKHIEETGTCVDYLDKIKTSSQHLLSLINDVLDMSRIESGRMEIHEESCSLTEIIDELDAILQNDANRKGLKLNISAKNVENDNVFCDKLRLNQVLLNCTSNAVKFTDEGGEVSVTLEQIFDNCVDSGFGKYRFEISDTGIGMSPEYLKKIFDPFSREENKVHKIEGTGLGMTICKNIVDMMKGTIDVKSTLGEGTTFIIELSFKLAQNAEEKKEEKTFDVESLKGKRILMAEDNELNTEIAEIILTEAGFVVEHAQDGQVCVDMLKAAEAGYYDMILMDIQMPNLNGYEATKVIRKMGGPKSKIPIIAMTANAFEEDKKLARNVGMNAHVAKPISVPILLETMARVFSR